MKNIFENAYLGKPYRTRDGRRAIFYNHHNSYAREKARYVTMILENQEAIYRWYYDGTATDEQEHLDIISEWEVEEEEITDEEIDRLADEEWYVYPNTGDPSPDTKSLAMGFKHGYRRALKRKSTNA